MPATVSKNTRFLPGLKPVLELLRNSPQSLARLFCKRELRECEHIATLARAANIPISILDQRELDKLCHDAGHIVAHQGLLAELAPAPPLPLENLLQQVANAPLPLLLALDQIKDPGNLGTLARTAWALGAAGILLPAHESASPGPAAMKSSAGALGLLPVCIVPNLAKALDEAEEHGLEIYGTGEAPHKNDFSKIQNAFTVKWRLPAVLVLGSEANGLRPGVRKRCGSFIAIPFARDFDSLNIAQAGAILLGLCASRHEIPKLAF